MFTVLFVCTGNTCRSPMAERLLRHLVKSRDLPIEIRSISAGVLSRDDEAMSDHAQAVLKAHAIDAAGFGAAKLRQEYVDASDLILTMTDAHANGVVDLFPDAYGKVFTLGAFSGKGKNVSDPFGLSTAEYERCFRQLEEMITAALPKIISLAKGDKEK